MIGSARESEFVVRFLPLLECERVYELAMIGGVVWF